MTGDDEKENNGQSPLTSPSFSSVYQPQMAKIKIKTVELGKAVRLSTV